jgi:hypothetical protein
VNPGRWQSLETCFEGVLCRRRRLARIFAITLNSIGGGELDHALQHGRCSILVIAACLRDVQNCTFASPDLYTLLSLRNLIIGITYVEKQDFKILRHCN